LNLSFQTVEDEKSTVSMIALPTYSGVVAPLRSNSTITFELKPSWLKEGLLLRKHIKQGDAFLWSKRLYHHRHHSWKSYYTVIDPKGELHFYKVSKEKQNVMTPMLIIRHAIAERLHNVTKKKKPSSVLNQFKLTLHDGSIYYFQLAIPLHDYKQPLDEEIDLWIQSINYVAARRTVSSLPLATGSNWKNSICPKLSLLLSEMNEVS
jgi:hypothetical protein